MSFDSYDGELPLSLDQLRDQWNAQADDFNQWDSLGLDEQIGWAQARAAGLPSTTKHCATQRHITRTRLTTSTPPQVKATKP